MATAEALEARKRRRQEPDTHLHKTTRIVTRPEGTFEYPDFQEPVSSMGVPIVLLSKHQAAQAMAISVDTLETIRRAGCIDSCKLGGQRRYSIHAIRAYVAGIQYREEPDPTIARVISPAECTSRNHRCSAGPITPAESNQADSTPTDEML